MTLNAKTWTVELRLTERDGSAHAQATLYAGMREAIIADGDARVSTEDPVEGAETGYEMAAARALINLGVALRHVADAEVRDLLRTLYRT